MAIKFQKEPMNAHSSIKHVIGVVSGKGGVGKSFVTASMAAAMRKKGYEVGIMDADITGPSIPKMYGIHGKAVGDGKEILPEALSHGTLEQIYLAFRLAVGEIVTKEEPMPVIFDEAFGMYDEKRLMQTLRALDCQIRKEQGRQILIFTCQKREMELLEQSGITYHKIVLE